MPKDKLFYLLNSTLQVTVNEPHLVKLQQCFSFSSGFLQPLSDFFFRKVSSLAQALVVLTMTNIR
ncbi:MAG TPA: hypothetical protein PKX93_12030, partial [bacterium]|nr:hypothetical protein [bacterium]